MPGTRFNSPQIPANITTAAVIVAADSGRKSVTITNTGANALAVGSFAAVTAVTGLILQPGESLTTNAAAVLYGLSTSGTTVSFQENLKTN